MVPELILLVYLLLKLYEEIKKLKTKILIIQGTTDIQVEEKDAEKLHLAVPKSQLKIIEGMKFNKHRGLSTFSMLQS